MKTINILDKNGNLTSTFIRAVSPCRFQFLRNIVTIIEFKAGLGLLDLSLLTSFLPELFSSVSEPPSFAARKEGNWSRLAKTDIHIGWHLSQFPKSDAKGRKLPICIWKVKLYVPKLHLAKVVFNICSLLFSENEAWVVVMKLISTESKLC